MIVTDLTTKCREPPQSIRVRWTLRQIKQHFVAILENEVKRNYVPDILLYCNGDAS